MNQSNSSSNSSPSNSAKNLNLLVSGNQCIENTAAFISKNDSRDVENSMATTTRVKSLERSEVLRPEIDIKARNATVTLVGTEKSQGQLVQTIPQRKNRYQRMADELRQQREEGREMVEKIKIESSEFITLCNQFKESVNSLEEKHQVLEENLQTMHQTTQSVTLEVLNQCQKINQSLEEAKEKAEMNLQLAQLQPSNENGLESTIQQLKITHNNFQEIANNADLDSQNITHSIETLNIENDEIKKTVSLINNTDQV